MNKFIYRYFYTINLLLLINTFFGRTPATNTLCIKASSDFLTIKWQPLKGTNVLVVASTDNDAVILNNSVFYIASSEFGKGSKIGNAYVIYNGNQTSVKITGLKAETKYFFSIFESNACDNFDIPVSQELRITDAISGQKAQPVPMTPLTVYTVVCPAVAGITTSLTGTTNSGTSIASAAACPHVGYADPGAMNPWTSAAGTGVIRWMFSSPVKSSTLRMNSVNSNDYGTISASGGSGGTISLSGLICMGVSGLVVGPLTVASAYGGVYFAPTSTGSYTMITLTNTGAQSGFVAACPTAITSAVLPIELLNFEAECYNSMSVKLKWKTITEHNNDYFTVERSQNGEAWETITTIKGAGNSTELLSYEYIDRNVPKGINYYRLKQTDFDKTFVYSLMTLAENCSNTIKEEISLYPNPASREIVINNFKSTAEVEIYSILGEKINTFTITESDNKLSTENLTDGNYIFKIICKEETKLIRVVIAKF